MKFYRIIILVVMLIATSFSYSIVSAQEIIQTWEGKCKNEPYLMLYKERIITINKDYSAVETFHKKAVVLTEAGKSLGEIELPYDKSREEIKDIDAFTIAPDGTKQHYVKIQDLNTSTDNAVYTDTRKKIITMPNVVKGSVIEWQGTHVYKTPVIDKNFYDHFHLTFEDFPVKENVCRVIAPRNMKVYFKNLNTTLKPHIDNKGDEVIYTWVSKNNDKAEREELMPPTENINQIVLISTMNDWSELSDWMLSLFRRNSKITPEIKQKVHELTGNKATTGEKVQAIIEYIQREFRYVSMDIEFHNYEPHTVAEIYSNKYGDCKDLTLLSMVMLAEIGVKARPALSSGVIELRREDLLPMPFYFNHVFLNYEIEGKQYFTDVLLKGYRFDEIPAALSGKKVFIVNDQGGSFSEVPRANDSEVSNTLNQMVTIHDDGTTLVDLRLDFSNSVSVGIKQLLKAINDNMKEKFFAGIEVPILSGGTLIGRTWGNLESPFSSIFLKLEFEHPNRVERMGNMMTFGSPQVQRQAAFAAPKRKNPIVFSSTQQTKEISTYILPADYVLMKLPQNVSVQTPFADYIRNYSIEEGKVIEKETLSYKAIELPAKEYEAVQNFYTEVARQTADKIIIKKKSKIAESKDEEP